ncbi:MAG TPA: 30S ribosome-binding factor RbfA [Chloroflexia bacterium]|nr:30S ribosome-binding factor RbfA [Chloroflexia bacterium]
MPSRRQQQVADLIQREISVLVQRELKDPRLGFVTITSVEVSPDLRYARIFYSVMGTPEEQKGTQQALEHASGFLRHALAGRIEMRYVPEISFRNDPSIAQGDRIARLLAEIEPPTAPAGGGDAAEETPIP